MSASPPRLALHSRPAKGANSVRRIAAIDVGSNSVRQIVADVTAEGGITVVDEMKAAPRLGADVDETGVLGTQAMQAAAEAIGRMATLARQLGAHRIDAVATSAVRDAANADEFLARLANGLGKRRGRRRHRSYLCAHVASPPASRSRSKDRRI